MNDQSLKKHLNNDINFVVFFVRTGVVLHTVMCLSKKFVSTISMFVEKSKLLILLN